MEYKEGFSQIENLEDGKERYEENLRLLEKAKDKFVEMGLFDRDYIKSISFVFIDSYNDKEDKNNQLTKNGLIVPHEESDRAKEVGILTQSYLDTIDGQFDTASEKNKSQRVWLGNLEMSVFLSFDAATAHEIAHAKSYSVIDKNRESTFDEEKFKKLVFELIKKDSVFKKDKSVDLSKFDYSDENWSELYALLYHREFLRRKNSDNSKIIEEWDNHIIEVASDLKESVKKFNKEKDTNIDPEIIYEDCHAFSFLLARVFEEKYEDFDERIRALELCKKK